jgi:hypothetical protein
MAKKFEVTAFLPPFAPVIVLRPTSPSIEPATECFESLEEAEEHKRAGASQWPTYEWSIREIEAVEERG